MLMEERDLIWKFRFWLKSNPKALTKFVRSVNWQEKLEVRQAIQVILWVFSIIHLNNPDLGNGNQSMPAMHLNCSRPISLIHLFDDMRSLDSNQPHLPTFYYFYHNWFKHYGMNRLNKIWLPVPMRICWLLIKRTMMVQVCKKQQIWFNFHFRNCSKSSNFFHCFRHTNWFIWWPRINGFGHIFNKN